MMTRWALILLIFKCVYSNVLGPVQQQNWSWFNVSANRSAVLLSTMRNFLERDLLFVVDYYSLGDKTRPGGLPVFISLKYFHHSEPQKEDQNIITLAKNIQDLMPPFKLTRPAVKNAKCVKDSRKFVAALGSLELWALKMHDSSAKLPSGLLNGNVNQFGDFDLCVNALKDETLKGKYCLAYIQLHRESPSPLYHEIYNLLLSHAIFRSQLTDSGHRVPRFSTINWALCVPSSCTARDVQDQVMTTLERYTNNTGFQLEVKVEPGMCQIKAPSTFSMNFWITTGILLFIIALSIAATVWDATKESVPPIVSCFSARRNLANILSTKRDENDIATVHGVRMLNAIMLLLSHKSMAIFFSPYSNRTYMTDLLGKDWSVLARAAALYTDPFIMISGLLTAHSFFQRLDKGERINVRREYINRLFRIIPSMAAIILTCTFILPEIGSGPQWPLTVNHHAIKCKKYWWRNFLFIHNYFGFDDMCLTHTHHIGIDTQLFFLSPLLVWLVHKYHFFGISCLMGLAALSTGLRYYGTLEHSLSYFVYPGISNFQMFKTADYSYTIPMHRLSMYIIGVLLAFILNYCKKDYKLKLVPRRFGWTIALFLFYLSYIMPSSMGVRGYVYNPYSAALYAAFAPIAWTLMFTWLIFVDHIGLGGVVGKIFSLKISVIWTKLSYSIYLTQFPIFFYNVGVQRNSNEYYFMMQFNIWECVCILLASLALTVFIEYPFSNIRKFYIRRSPSVGKVK